MKKLSRQRAYQLRQVEKGLCAKCSRPRVTATYCKVHRVWQNEYQKERTRRGSSLDKALYHT